MTMLRNGWADTKPQGSVSIAGEMRALQSKADSIKATASSI